MKKLIYLVALVPLMAGGWLVTDHLTFDRAAWLEDFAQLESATEQSYANLKWTRTSKQADLVALHEQTLAALQRAKSNSEARHALEQFIAGFQDGHFHIEGGPPAPIAAVLAVFERDALPEVDFGMPAEAACRALGFRRSSHSLSTEGPAITVASNTSFAAGTVRTPSGRSYGIIRIPLFQQYEYGAACEQAWLTFQREQSGPCAEACQDRFHVVAKRAVAQALADDARLLARTARDGIIIDLTGNGGGTEWAEFAAVALTSKQLQAPGVAVIRGPHWQKASDVSPALLDSVRISCDVSAIWRDRSAQPACWNVVAMTPPPITHYDEYRVDRPYDGPLFIMTDAHTASASEQFAATLVDNGVAITIGEKTMGVGCGFTNGGNPTTLTNSGLVVWMPDCARTRRDGSNEFEGVKPNLEVSWGNGGMGKSRALVQALESLPKKTR